MGTGPVSSGSADFSLPDRGRRMGSDFFLRSFSPPSTIYLTPKQSSTVKQGVMQHFTSSDIPGVRKRIFLRI